MGSQILGPWKHTSILMNFLHIGIKKKFGIEFSVARNFKQISQLTIPLEVRDFQIQVLQKSNFSNSSTARTTSTVNAYSIYIYVYMRLVPIKKKSFGQINWCLLNIYSPTSTRFYLLASFAFSMYFCWHEVHTDLITKVETELKKSNRRIALIQWGKNNKTRPSKENVFNSVTCNVGSICKLAKKALKFLIKFCVISKKWHLLYHCRIK